jgi:NitT/TauT family transport system substrate-binding protein
LARLTERRNVVIFAMVTLVVAVIISSFVYLNFQKPYSGNVESISVGFLPNEYATLIYIANDQQYFSANGLNVTLKSYSSGSTAVNSVINGEVNVAIASEFVLVEDAFANANVSTFGSIGKGLGLYLVGKTDLGITNISDLKNKDIGVQFGTAAEFFLGVALKLNGIDLSQVTLTNVANPQQPNVIVNGTVDAVATLQPFVSQIQNLLPNKTVTLPLQSGQPFYFDAIATNSWLATHPNTVTRFLKSLIQAQSYVANNQKQAMEIIAGRLNYTSSYLANVWADYQFTVSLDESQVLAMQNEARWLISNNLTIATSVPNFLNYIYVSGLESVKSSAVNIIS